MNLFSAFRLRRERARAIQNLSRLDDRLLRDIGIDRGQLGLVQYDAFVRLQDLGR